MTRSRFGRKFLEIYKDNDYVSERQRRLSTAEKVAKNLIGQIVDSAIEEIDRENSGWENLIRTNHFLWTNFGAWSPNLAI